MTPPPGERLIYGCVGAARPEAEPFIDEVNGVLVYTCLACRQTLGDLASPPPGQYGCSPPAAGTGPSPA